MSESSNIKDAADAVKGIVQAVPIYQDALQPAAKEVGTALQTVAKTLHILLAPVGAMVWGFEQIKGFVSEKVATKLKGTPVERLQAPEANVAGPALEALKYTGYQDSLRELYATLLATAIDSKTAASAHPSFVDMIKQMSPDEALILRVLALHTNYPLIDVREEAKNSSLGNWALRHFSLVAVEAGCKRPEIGAAYLGNLQRLGLIELRENYILRRDEEDLYKGVQDRPEVQIRIKQINEKPDHKATVIRGAILLTELGRQFCYACVYEGTHSNDGKLIVMMNETSVVTSVKTPPARWG
jgi:hypothetical protein